MDENLLINWRNHDSSVLYRHNHSKSCHFYAQPRRDMGGGIDQSRCPRLVCSTSCSWTCNRLVYIIPADDSHLQAAIEPSTEIGRQPGLYERCLVSYVFYWNKHLLTTFSACIASALKIYYSSNLNYTVDITWATLPVNIVTYVSSPGSPQLLFHLTSLTNRLLTPHKSNRALRRYLLRLHALSRIHLPAPSPLL